MGNSIQATNNLQELLMLWKKEGTILSKVRESDVRILEELCKGGADLNYLDRERGFGLISKVYLSVELMKFFVDRGADVNSQNEKGDTALHLAIRHALYENDIYDDDGNTICITGIHLIRFLLNDLNADPNVTNLRDETALFEHAKRIGTEVYFPEFYNSKQYQKGNMGKVAELLVDRGVDVTARNCDGESVLHKCVYDINKHIIQKFNVGEVDIRTSSWLYSKTPLMVAAACKENCVENCSLLLDRDADINARDLQGYTALHYAVLNGVQDCAQFLMQKGADPNVKSGSGNDVYDMNLYHQSINYEVFTQGATPEKQIKILEIVGAKRIMLLKKIDKKYSIELWNKVKVVCQEFKIQPSREFLDNYEFLRQNNPEEESEEIRLSAMNTIARLSEGRAKFWNLLSAVSYWNSVFNILNFLSEELKDVEDFASLEEVDFYSLLKVVEFFKNWLEGKFKSEGSKNEVTPERIISHVHSIARLVIACFNKLTHVTDSNKLTKTCMKLYVKLCHVLMSLRSRFADVIPEMAFNDNKRLLKELINLDLRDRDSNSLMHLVVKNVKTSNPYVNYDAVRFEIDLVATLLDDFESIIDIKTKNRKGFEPVQLINSNNYSQSLEDVLVKMADRGAHVDARNVKNGPTLREVFEKEERPDLAFHYDNLQCACARVVARNLVPFRNKMPKAIVDFINMH